MKTIPLTKGKVARVDDEDYWWLSQHKWCYSESSGGYALRNGPRIDGKKTKHILMHREILGTPDGMDTDHQDGNRLNNQKYNLRPATKVQNQGNRAKTRNRSSKYKGVWFDKERGKFSSMIQVDGKRRCLGRFDDEIEAAKAYDTAALQLFGEFAKLNFYLPLTD